MKSEDLTEFQVDALRDVQERHPKAWGFVVLDIFFTGGSARDLWLSDATKAGIRQLKSLVGSEIEKLPWVREEEA